MRWFSKLLSFIKNLLKTVFNFIRYWIKRGLGIDLESKNKRERERVLKGINLRFQSEIDRLGNTISSLHEYIKTLKKEKKEQPYYNEINRKNKIAISKFGTALPSNKRLVDPYYLKQLKENEEIFEAAFFKKFLLSESFLKKKRERNVGQASLKNNINQKLKENKSKLKKQKTNNVKINLDAIYQYILQLEVFPRRDNGEKKEFLKRWKSQKERLNRVLVEKEKERQEKERLKKIKEEAERRFREQEEQKRLREEALKKERKKQKEALKKAEEVLRKKQKLALLQGKRTDWKQVKQVLVENRVKHLYHFTDRVNIPSIKKNGGLISWNYSNREGIDILRPGSGWDARVEARRYGLSNYISLSFCEDHPMKFKAKQEGRIQDPVLLKISLDVCFFNLTMFTDMNAADSRSSRKNNLEFISNLRFDLFPENYFLIKDMGGHEYKYYQAEILVDTILPIEYILNIDDY